MLVQLHAPESGRTILYNHQWPGSNIYYKKELILRQYKYPGLNMKMNDIA
jgi:hypothetical protein